MTLKSHLIVNIFMCTPLKKIKMDSVKILIHFSVLFDKLVYLNTEFLSILISQKIFDARTFIPPS